MLLRNRLADAWEALRTSYWFVPMVMALAAAGLAVLTVGIDHRITIDWPERLRWIRAAGPEGSRAVLAAVVGSIITVTGVVFSVTIVALTLASSQFGPRLLRSFLRDRGNQVVLGALVATFLYNLLVLRAVGREDRVPHLATLAGVALAVVSLFVLIYFVHHSASSIQASSVIAAVADEIDERLPSLFPERLGEGVPVPSGADEVRERLAEQGRGAFSISQGYVRLVDTDAVLELAVEHDLRIELCRRPGDFVCAGSLLARIGPEEKLDDAVVSKLVAAFVTGPSRTPVQDLGFLTDQLTEMAVRALSPGVNDPQTAVSCVDRLGAVIAALSEREMPSAARADGSGTLRVVSPVLSFEEVVAGCLDPIRRYGAGHAQVVEAVMGTLRELGAREVPSARRRVLVEHADELHRAFRRSTEAGRDLARIAQAHREVRDALA